MSVERGGIRPRFCEPTTPGPEKAVNSHSRSDTVSIEHRSRRGRGKEHGLVSGGRCHRTEQVKGRLCSYPCGLRKPFSANPVGVSLSIGIRNTRTPEMLRRIELL